MEQAPHPFARPVDLPRRRQANVQRLAVAAAAVIGVLLVVSLMSSRLAGVQAPAHRPVGDYGPPPAGVPLFYVGDPDHPGWYVGFDWNGVPRGTIKLAQPLTEFTNLVQAPDGSAFFADDRGLNYGPPLDRLGKPQDPFPIPSGLRQLVWADDNRHLCSLAYQNGGALLSWHVPAYTSNVAVVAKEPDPQMGVGGTIGILACAFATDQRAVLVRDSGLHPTEYWVVELGDGRVIAHSQVPSGFIQVVASSDGRYIAENAYTAKATRVVELSTGHVTDLDPATTVLAFSGDDKVVLVAQHGGVSAGRPSHLAMIDLATGKLLWTYDGPDEMAAYLVEPVGAAFAILLQDPKDQSLHPPVSVLMAYAQGPSPAVPGRFARP